MLRRRIQPQAPYLLATPGSAAGSLARVVYYLERETVSVDRNAARIINTKRRVTFGTETKLIKKYMKY